MNLGQDLHGTGREKYKTILRNCPNLPMNSIRGMNLPCGHAPHIHSKGNYIIQANSMYSVRCRYITKTTTELKSLSVGPRLSDPLLNCNFLFHFHFISFFIFDSSRISSRVSHLSGTYIPRCIPDIEDNWSVSYIVGNPGRDLRKRKP